MGSSRLNINIDYCLRWVLFTHSYTDCQNGRINHEALRVGFFCSSGPIHPRL